MNVHDLPAERDATAVWDAHLARTPAEIRERALPEETDRDPGTGGVDQQPRRGRDAWPDARPRADPERIREALAAEGEDWLLRLYEQFVEADRR